MEILLTRSLETLLFPPASIILVTLLGLALLRRHRGAAVTLIAASALGLYVLSMPVTARTLLSYLETYPALSLDTVPPGAAQAIVVLGGGRYIKAPDYGGDTLSESSLERVRYAAHLQKRTGLPVLVTGGDPLREGGSDAALMKHVLNEEYHVPDVWMEERSRTTGENALFSRALLDERGVRRVYLVTHAWHMARALRIFEQAGVSVIPAPTRFLSIANKGNQGVLGWLPRAGALEDTTTALHELLGSVWYQLRY